MLRLSLFGPRQFDAINLITVLLYGALSAASYRLEPGSGGTWIHALRHRCAKRMATARRRPRSDRASDGGAHRRNARREVRLSTQSQQRRSA
jgi:hypothetical protein